jgi:UDP-2-acetamido-3-amino-2,3-dideoxy-glucuronate N-acetyltransferase
MTLKVAVIGAGYWGRNLVRNFHELGALAAVCDMNETVLAGLRTKHQNVAFWSDISKVLEDPTINAVAIATPAVSHFSLASRALEAGKDVFVEKPLAISVEDGEKLASMAESSGRILMVGHILRYHPAIIKLRELIRDGRLGRIQYLYSNRLNIGKIRTEENILWSFAPHDISVMLALLDEMPDSASCQGGAYLNPSIFDVTLSQFHFASGVRAHIFVSWLHPLKEQR